VPQQTSLTTTNQAERGNKSAVQNQTTLLQEIPSSTFVDTSAAGALSDMPLTPATMWGAARRPPAEA